MADSFRTDGSRAVDDASDADRDAKIEQLLLAGLDHYFAARYEHAINVWTRALFFDRSHPRARAYIERARSALAEAQRHSEELLQNGVAALNRGHGHEARRLLQAAIDHGARPDDVRPLMDRLNREPGGNPAKVDGPRRRAAGRLRSALTPRTSASASTARGRRRAWAGLLALVALIALAGYSIALRGGVEPWFGAPNAPAITHGSPAALHATLPLPRRGETALNRAKAFAVRGKLHEALSALDLVRATDPERPEADRVRSELQRQLLGLTPAVAPPAAAPRERAGGRQP